MKLELTPEAVAARRTLADALPTLTPRPSTRTRDPLEVQCRLYLELLRWPAGVACPRCDESDRLLWLESRDKWHCYACRYQFSVTAGTLFHQSHLPLWKWFVGVQLMIRSERPLAAFELARLLGGSYKSFWFMTHRIRLALAGEPAAGAVAGAGVRKGKYRHAYEGERSWRRRHALEPDAFRQVVQRLLGGGHVSYRMLVDTAPRPSAAFARS